MAQQDSNVWVRGCIEWMTANVKAGWTPYYIDFKIKPCEGGVTIPQIHDWIRWQFYRRFCSRFVASPFDKGTRHLLPQLWLFPNFSDAGIVNRRDRKIASEKPLHFRGIMHLPPSRFFKKCPVRHIQKKQSEYAQRGIAAIKLEYVHDVSSLIASKILKWGFADEDNILILPAAPAQLATDAPFHSPVEEVDYIRSALRVSRYVARALFLAIYRKEGLRINPKTAEVLWNCPVVSGDPYEIFGDVDCNGKEHFARAPGSNLWVVFDDLPTKTLKALWKRTETERRTFEKSVPIWSPEQ